MKVMHAQAEAERIKMIGGAEASSLEAVGKAQAEEMRLNRYFLGALLSHTIWNVV